MSKFSRLKFAPILIKFAVFTQPYDFGIIQLEIISLDFLLLYMPIRRNYKMSLTIENTADAAFLDLMRSVDTRYKAIYSLAMMIQCSQ